MKVEVDPEFKTLISPLTDDELKGLETKLLNEGFKEPLKGWAHDGIMTLLDGHNRLEICRRLGIKYRVEPVKGIEGRESAKKWIIDNQLSRRNLTREQARYLRGLMFNLEKRQGARTDLTSHQNDAKSGKGGVRKQLSEQYGVSEATLTRDGAYAGQIRRIKEIAPDLAANILNQKVKATDEELTQLSQLTPDELKAAEAQVKAGAIEIKELMPTKPKGDNDRQLTINDDGDVVAVKEMKKYYLEKKRPGLEFGAICELSLLEGRVKYNSTAGDFVYETACFREGSEKSFELALDGLLNTCSGCMNLKDGCKKIADHKVVAKMIAKQLAPLGLLDAGKAWKKVIYGGGYALVGWVKYDDGKPEFMVCVDALNVARVPDNDIVNIGKIERKHLISVPVNC